MASEEQKFRLKWGVTKMQHWTLSRMTNGEIRRDQIADLRSTHVLTDRGILEYVPSTTRKITDGFWRLTDQGRGLVDSWS